MDLSSVCQQCQWRAALRFLPFDLDGLAVETGALSRRRGVEGGESLLRALLLCALPKVSLLQASALARESGIAKLNKTAMFKRLCRGEEMLRILFAHALRFSANRQERWGKYRTLAADATSLSGPASKGTDQRLHVVYDLGSGLPAFVEQTGAEGGETLRRYAEALGPGDLVLGDRGYGHARGLLAALSSGAQFLVRFEFSSIRLLDEGGQKVAPELAETRVPAEGIAEFPVMLEGWAAPLRAMGSRNPEGKAVWLLTSLPSDELPLNEARELYSRRWQIELFFKRLKSLLDLDDMPTRDGPTKQAWIWAKLLLAALAVLIADERFSPWGGPFENRGEQVADVRVRGEAARKDAAGTRGPAQKRPPQRQAKAPAEDAEATPSLEA